MNGLQLQFGAMGMKPLSKVMQIGMQFSFALVFLLVGTGNIAWAAVDEIVVTATKRETTIQTTAGAISAMSGEQMKFRGQVNAQDMAFNVPGLVYGELLGTPQITIRGVGLSVETGVAEMGVATYLNGVFLSRAGLANLALGDIERAEVLRGPQGTLYGRNATGGAINFITRRPGDEFEVSAIGSYASRDTLKVEGAVSGPIWEDRLSARLFAKFDKTDGTLEDLSPLAGFDRLGAYEATNLRGTVVAKPFDDVEIAVQAGYIEKEGPYIVNQITAVAGIPLPTHATDPVYTTEPHKVYSNVEPSAYQDNLLLSATVTWQFEQFNIKSVTGYTERHAKEQYDADGRDPVVGVDFNSQLLGVLGGGPFDPLTGFFDQLFPSGVYVDTDVYVDRQDNYRTFTQEFNIAGQLWDRLNFIVGFFYMRENGDLYILSRLGSSNPPPVALTPIVGSFMDEKNTSIAGFADLTFSITDELRVVLGARYGTDKKESVQFDASVGGLALNGFSVGGDCPNDPPLEVTNFNPKIGVEFDPFEDTLLYATFQSSTKPGGYNLTVCGDAFEQEELASFEAGFKSRLFDGRLVVNGTGYYYDYENYQVFQLRPPFTAEILNAPKAHVIGAEFEVYASFVEWLDIDLGFAYMDGKYDEFTGVDGIFKTGIVLPQEQDLSGNTLTRAPKYSFNGGVEFTIPIDIWKIDVIKLRGETAYTSRVYFRQFNTEFDYQDPYWVSNIIVAAASRDGNYMLRGFIRNLTDTNYLVSQLSNALEVFAVLPDAQGRQAAFLGIYGPPRTMGAELTLRF